MVNRNVCSATVVEWRPASERERGAWANDIDATELGAYALALAAVEISDGLVAVRRAEHGTGADYYVAPVASGKVDDLERWLRLEVSGVDHGPEGEVDRRLGLKLTQASAGDSDLPAVACVVGFKAKLIKLADLKLDEGGD